MQENNLTLVTGTPGWLGTRLVEVLRGKGREVRSFVLNGMDASYLRKLGSEIVYGDVKDRESVKKAVKNVKTVFHCASVEHMKRAKECYEVNFKGTENLLKESSKAGVKKFIFVSTVAARGVNVSRDAPLREEDENRPYSHYGKSKNLAEKIVRDFHKSGKIKTIIVKPNWFYGPNLPEKTLFLVRMIKDGKPLMFGEGNTLKSMTYIDNVVDSLLLAEKSQIAEGETYLIADQRPYTVREIYEEIAKNLGVEIKPRHMPVVLSRICEKIDILLGKIGLHSGKIFSAGEISRDMFVSIEKAKKELGYEPRIGLEEGMSKAIEWCKENNAI
ncbi:MAG: NAD-dependent epimerase/dehydratase family protein [Candidatus Aenigmarchaeota archaeon]|nr:NAD-dependent epimerase/dehydratase family protein [Candidatus Aenigmarchaeota archaeon]